MSTTKMSLNGRVQTPENFALTRSAWKLTAVALTAGAAATAVVAVSAVMFAGFVGGFALIVVYFVAGAVLNRVGLSKILDPSVGAVIVWAATHDVTGTSVLAGVAVIFCRVISMIAIRAVRRGVEEGWAVAPVRPPRKVTLDRRR